MPASESALLGLVTRKERWSLTWRGWLVALALSTGLGALFIWRMHPFLAPTEPVDTEYLVVEGHLPNYALEESVAEFKAHGYRKLFTVGAQIMNGTDLDPGDNHADYARARLKWLGMDPGLIQSVPSLATYRNRTYSSALALRDYFQTNQIPVRAINVVSCGVHARRSRLLFEKAFANKVKVGIIAVTDREYDPDRWWKYSEGVKEIMSEGASYLYARLLFHPASKSDRDQ